MKPYRTNLSVPGHISKMHPKAFNSSADVIMLDLEDSVPLDKKDDAKKQVIRTLLEAAPSGRQITVRINAVDSELAFREIIDLVGSAGNRISALVVPKINHPGDIHFVARLMEGVEIESGIEKPISIEASIETARGLERASEIAQASPRIISLVFGVADYTESVGASLTSLSGHGENESDGYPGHRWHYPLSKMVAAAKANDLMAIDAPYGNFKNPDGLKRSAGLSRALGCDGKWVIHPAQIDAVNQVFSPSDQDIKRAKAILEAIETAGQKGKGAIGVQGKMIDQATLRLARKVWDQAIQLGLI